MAITYANCNSQHLIIFLMSQKCCGLPVMVIPDFTESWITEIRFYTIATAAHNPFFPTISNWCQPSS